MARAAFRMCLVQNAITTQLHVIHRFYLLLKCMCVCGLLAGRACILHLPDVVLVQPESSWYDRVAEVSLGVTLNLATAVVAL